MVECFLAKEDVAGSTPVSRSKLPSFCDKLLKTQQLLVPVFRWCKVQGAVPKW